MLEGVVLGWRLEGLARRVGDVPCREAMVLFHELTHPLQRILPVEADDGIAMSRPFLRRRPLQRAGFPFWANAAATGAGAGAGAVAVGHGMGMGIAWEGRSRSRSWWHRQLLNRGHSARRARPNGRYCTVLGCGGHGVEEPERRTAEFCLRPPKKRTKVVPPSCTSRSEFEKG
jgi:hypothetical protein